MPIPIISVPTMPENKEQAWDTVKYLIPGIGTYYSIKDAKDNPTVGNIVGAGLSGLGDITAAFGVGSFLKGMSGVNKAQKAAKTAQAAYTTAFSENNNARNNAVLAMRRAKKARANERAVTSLDGGDKGMSRIIEYEKRAQNAENTANNAINEYRKSSYSLDGYIPQTISENPLYKYNYNPNSYKSIMDNANHSLDKAQNYYNKAKIRMPLSVLGGEGLNLAGSITKDK